MSFTEPVRKTATTQYKRQKYPLPIRIWHWLNVIVIGGLLITVLINATLTNKKNVKSRIIGESGNNGFAINDRQATNIAHTLSDKTWDVHVYFGYTLAALLLFRLILEFFQLDDQKLIRVIKNFYRQFQTVKMERELTRHKLSVKILYAMFYIVLIIIVTTGLLLAFEPSILKSVRHTIKQVHGFCMYIVLVFIILHISGFIRAEHKQDKGIVSDMINGGNME